MMRNTEPTCTVAKIPEGKFEIIEVNGSLDAFTAELLESSINESVDAKRYSILIDGSSLNYISSAGLGVFMSYIEEIREEGGDIKIFGLEPDIYSVFELLGFPLIFDIKDTKEECITIFEQNGGSE
ncbi:MAG: STAS domain-containing protein [Candidatus Kapaibacteriales bacterium]